MLDPVSIERAESEIDFFIERRARERQEANEIAEAWSRSERAYHERHRREARAQWYAFHLDQAERITRTAEDLASEHRAKALALLSECEGN